MLRLSGHRPGEHAPQLRGRRRHQGAERRGRDAEPLHRDRSGRRPLEREASSHRFVQGERERIHVSGRARPIPLQHFRGKVSGRPENLAGGVGRHRPRHSLGHAEIGDFYHSVLVDEDVLRLDVAVHDALTMGVGECGGGLPTETHNVGPWKTSVQLQQVTQRRPVDVLHH